MRASILSKRLSSALKPRKKAVLPGPTAYCAGRSRAPRCSSITRDVRGQRLDARQLDAVGLGRRSSCSGRLGWNFEVVDPAPQVGAPPSDYPGCRSSSSEDGSRVRDEPGHVAAAEEHPEEHTDEHRHELRGAGRYSGDSDRDEYEPHAHEDPDRDRDRAAPSTTWCTRRRSAATSTSVGSSSGAAGAGLVSAIAITFLCPVRSRA